MKGPSDPSEGLHVAKGARLLHVPSASDSSLGSAGTMEKAWHQADSCEVISREGQPGAVPMKMLFSGYRASLKAKAAETIAQLATLEDADKVGVLSHFLQFCCYPGSPPRHGPAARSRSGFRLDI
jgi:hypothetical protein